MNNQSLILGLVPLIVLSLGALITLLLAPSKKGSFPSFLLTFLSLFLAFAFALFNFYSLPSLTSYGDAFLYFDNLSNFSTIILCAGALLSSLNFYGNAVGKDQIQNEIFPLLLLSLVGMILLVSTNHLLMMFVALEIMSLSVYVLVSMRRTTQISSEAGLKYFIMGGAASGLFLYGSALLLGHYGSFNLTTLSSMESSSLLTLTGTMLIVGAVLFKIGAFPFHAWVPDVYQGAVSPVTGYMAASVKFAGFLILIRLAESLFTSPFFIFIGIIAILTMIYGNIMALRQENLKRMLAYSSIAHTGYLLIGLMASEENLMIGHQALLVYLTLYLFSTLGTFAILSLFPDDTNFEKIKGLGRRHPYLSTALCLFMLSFAGIPLTSGFIGKFLIFSSAIIHGTPLILSILTVAILTSLISLGYYIPVITHLFGYKDEDETQSIFLPVIFKSTLTVIMITIIITLSFGLFPLPLINITKF